MKNVTMSVKLRRLAKSLLAGLIMLTLAFAGTAFNPFSKVNGRNNSAKDMLAINRDGFEQLCYTADFFDPIKSNVTQLNPKAVSFVQRYLLNEEENLERMKVWGKPYFNIYDKVLEQHGLPKELKYLSVIESSLVHDVKSSAGAAGPWQIMASEARRVGLKVNGQTDERLSFNKSTEAAAKILQELHGLFGDWLLVVAAYNCGEVRMQQAIRKSGSKNFWVLQSYLPAQTRAHVKRFIGTYYIFEGDGGLTTMTAAQINKHQAVDRS